MSSSLSSSEATTLVALAEAMRSASAADRGAPRASSAPVARAERLRRRSSTALRCRTSSRQPTSAKLRSSSSSRTAATHGFRASSVLSPPPPSSSSSDHADNSGGPGKRSPISSSGAPGKKTSERSIPSPPSGRSVPAEMIPSRPSPKSITEGATTMRGGPVEARSPSAERQEQCTSERARLLFIPKPRHVILPSGSHPPMGSVSGAGSGSPGGVCHGFGRKTSARLPWRIAASHLTANGTSSLVPASDSSSSGANCTSAALRSGSIITASTAPSPMLRSRNATTLASVLSVGGSFWRRHVRSWLLMLVEASSFCCTFIGQSFAVETSCTSVHTSITSMKSSPSFAPSELRGRGLTSVFSPRSRQR
mmetsp:Transcript_7694/g.25492  ORF Transcript_7694/g.25492 Transcript_7694/m.25492 type:complete len:366 (+) Transcript_7694:216-1313(+)